VFVACRKPIRLHYLGVSFGLTQQLYNFWQRAGYAPAYIRQSASDVTGEHTCVMLQALQHPEVSGTAWLEPFVTDFKARFMSLLGGAFRGMAPALALSILNPKLQFSELDGAAGVQAGLVVMRGDGRQMTAYDLKRLQVCFVISLDYHSVLWINTQWQSSTWLCKHQPRNRYISMCSPCVCQLISVRCLHLPAICYLHRPAVC
jgi:N-acetyltransferase 10